MTRWIQIISIRLRRILCLFSTLLLSLISAGPSDAASETPDLSGAEQEAAEPAIKPLRSATVQSGYRFITPDGPSTSASPYGRLTSGIIGGFSAGSLGTDLKLSSDGTFLHQDDYHTELFLDYRGLVRFHAESGALWHNLPREQVNPGSITYLPIDQSVTYGVRTAMSQADTRVKLGNNPVHLNLGYWELDREGYDQLRFSDYFHGSASNTIISESRRVNQKTREGNAGFDAHLGPLDLTYGFRIRDFSNTAPDSRYTFTNDAFGALAPGNQVHDAVPGSRVMSHTFKLFSDLSGGLVGSASYNMTQRENAGGHGEALPAERPSDIIHSIAGDLTYTPSKRHSFAIKYRHREIDRTAPASLYYRYSLIPAPPSDVHTTVPGVLLVRPASSSSKDTLTFSATFRPAPTAILRLEYNAELETRDNIRTYQAPAESLAGYRSDRSQTHAGTANFYWKPLNGVKMNASYRYEACDNPSYGTSFTGRHTGKLLISYSNSGTWGATGSYLAEFESGLRTESTVAPAPVASYAAPRENRTGSGNASIWVSPLERLTITAQYSYLEAHARQSLLFSSIIADPSPLAASSYHSFSHVYGIDAVYSVIEPLDISLAFQQVRSQARFEVPDRSYSLAGLPGIYSTAGITGVSKIDSTETGVSARLDWRINSLLGCSLDYGFRLFESGQPLYDGSIHSTLLTLKARW